LSDVVDLGQALLDKIGPLDGIDGAQVATAKRLQDFLNSKLGAGTVTVTVAPTDIRFAFTYTDTFAKTFPLGFDLGGALGGLVSLNADGQLSVAASASVNLGLGITTAAGDIPILDRVFLTADTPNEVQVTATANVGYDLDNDGDLTDPGEAAPLNFKVGVGPV